MKVNIICENDGWVYGKFVEMFEKHSRNTILVNSKEQCDMVHYLPYYLVPKKPVKLCTSWQSHMEAKNPLRSKFIQAAKTVTCAISHSKKYADYLKQCHVGRVEQVIPGVDLKAFTLRDIARPPSDKLVIGYVGRQYSSSNRKNPQLLSKIGKLSFVDLRVTGGKVKAHDIPAFYAGLDIVISPATIEGGPMAIQEALAVGTPVLCFGDVGVANEFSTGVIKVPLGDDDEYISRLEVMWKTKSYLHWREAAQMKLMRDQVKHQTWDRFVRRHDSIWGSL